MIAINVRTSRLDSFHSEYLKILNICKLKNTKLYVNLLGANPDQYKKYQDPYPDLCLNVLGWRDQRVSKSRCLLHPFKRVEWILFIPDTAVIVDEERVRYSIDLLLALRDIKELDISLFQFLDVEGSSTFSSELFKEVKAYAVLPGSGIPYFGEADDLATVLSQLLNHKKYLSLPSGISGPGVLFELNEDARKFLNLPELNSLSELREHLESLGVYSPKSANKIHISYD